MKIRKEGLVLAVLLAVQLAVSRSTPAAPRPPLPPIPEFASLLYHESFDALYSSGSTNAQVITDKFTYAESWSGYALQRAGDAVMPFMVPALDAKGHTNVSCSQGTIRFWFKPAWSSAATGQGVGPGAVATLLALDVVGKGESANAWSLQVSVDEFDYVIINNDFASAVEDFSAVVRASRLRRVIQRARHPEFFRSLLESD